MKGALHDLDDIDEPGIHEDRGFAKKAAEKGPVVITRHGKLAFVLLAFEEYSRLTEARAGHNSIIDLLGMPGVEDIEPDILTVREEARPADLA